MTATRRSKCAVGIIGPGPDDSENDNWDPAWEDHDTSFRRWLYEKLTAAGLESSAAADVAGFYAPANRYNGLDDINMGIIAVLTGPDAVRAAHKADLDEWACEQQLRDHPDLAALDAELDRIQHRS
ncbi:hypothetical protein [Streptomyces sp. NPDC057199]|uniref:hypothetical protein n=1 Tax=Streptomyces sp. NPDC057199 TaxID=3346047 RepID=UPI003632F4AC